MNHRFLFLLVVLGLVMSACATGDGAGTGSHSSGDHTASETPVAAAAPPAADTPTASDTPAEADESPEADPQVVDAPDAEDGVERTIEIDMVDLAFEPSSIEVTEGETVRLRFSNVGQLPHDAFLGNADEQAEHEEQMAEHAEHAEHGAEEPNALTVEPGETGDLVHTFTGGETVMLGCHQPGHYDAGMVLAISVVAA